MDDEQQAPDAKIAAVARAMTPERRGRFLDAACGGDQALREAVEARLGAPVQDDALEAIAVEAVSAAPESVQSTEGNGVEEETSLIEDCQRRSLDLAARLRRFQDACRLVDRDHRHGRIHGDLGPGSFRVGPDGEVRLSSSEREEEEVDPRHMSPEQIVGEPITTATDVYGLGLLLYELLTGRYPYRITSALTEPDRDELCQAISEQAPERPSVVVARGEPSAVGIRELGRFLDGDLDLIVLKALQKEPERRYHSAAAMADDIERFLEGRPVQAHQPGRLYALKKFVRRHPVATTLGIAASTALALGLVGSILGLLHARRERSQAQAAYEAARTVLDELFTRIDREPALAAPDLVPARTAMLEALLHHYERDRDEPRETYQDRLEAVRFQQRIGRIYQRMGLPDMAAWQYEEAAETFKELAREADGTDLRDEQAELLGDLGQLLRARVDRRNEARAFLDQARSLLDGGPNPKASIPTRRALAKVLGNLAELERDEEHLDKAAADWRRAVEINRELASGTASAVEDRIALASALIGLGGTLAMSPDGTGQGLAELRQGVEIRQAVVRTFPQRFDQMTELARDLHDLAVLEQTAGQQGAAVQSASRSVEMYEHLDRRFPDTVAYQTDLYLAYDALSRLLALQNETRPALERSSQARTVLESLVSQYPKNRLFQLDLSRCHNFIGRIQQRRKDYAEALRSFQRAVDLLEGVPRLDGENSYQLAVNLGLSIALIGASADKPPPDDESTLSKADQIRRQAYGKRGVAAIKQAISEGFGNRELYQTDGDLDSLRDRPDFQKLIQELTDQKNVEKAAAP